MAKKSTKPKKATAAEKLAGARQLEVSAYDAQTIKNELAGTLSNFDAADARYQAEAEVQRQRNSAKSAGDRFSQLKKLQMSAKGMIGSAGNAMQGSQAGNLTGMLRTRDDLDNGEVLGTLRQDQGAVNSALTESMNANTASRLEAINAAEVGVRGLEAKTAAELQTIAASLYRAPGAGKAAVKGKKATKTSKAVAAKPAVLGVNFGSGDFAARRAGVKEYAPVSSGYYTMPPA